MSLTTKSLQTELEQKGPTDCNADMAGWCIKSQAVGKGFPSVQRLPHTHEPAWPYCYQFVRNSEDYCERVCRGWSINAWEPCSCCPHLYGDLMKMDWNNMRCIIAAMICKIQLVALISTTQRVANAHLIVTEGRLSAEMYATVMG